MVSRSSVGTENEKQFQVCIFETHPQHFLNNHIDIRVRGVYYTQTERKNLLHL